MNIGTETGKRRALGKGLEALLPSRTLASAPVSHVIPPESKSLEIPVDQIDRSPFQTRAHFAEEALKELAASIAANGLIQPVVVRPLPGGRYQLIAGERRWLASKLAGHARIPAVLRNVSDEQAMEMTLIENLQRTDLNPMEQARAYERLSREFKMTQEKMAQRTGKDRASVANFLRLLRLPPEAQQKVESGEISFGHARALLALEDPAAILSAAQKVVALSMSVRQAESYVQGILHPESKKKHEEPGKEPLDPNVREARDLLQRALGLKVRIEDKHGRGRVIIEYARLEDFDTLLAVLAPN